MGVHRVCLTLQRTQNTFPPNEGLANIHLPCHACSVPVYIMMIVQLLDAFPSPLTPSSPLPPPSTKPAFLIVGEKGKIPLRMAQIN
jgi:hypothetical protein